MLSEANWQRPLKWNRDAERAGVPAKVFCASMADVFEDHPQVVEPRKRLWDLIEATPNLVWQLLTKRPENIAGMVPWGDEWPSHVWLGTSVENQRYADTRIYQLLNIPAKTRFLSCEPLLGPVNLWHWINPSDPCVDCDVCGEERFPDEIGFGHDLIDSDQWCPGPSAGAVPSQINWVICGGESGSKARPMHPAWARSLRDQCQWAGVPFFFKQWGEHAPWAPEDFSEPKGTTVVYPSGETGWVAGDEDRLTNWTRGLPEGWAFATRVGKKAAGRELDGRTWDQFPRTAEAVTR